MQEHTSPATPSAWDEIKRQKTTRTCGCGMILYISLPSYTSIPYSSTSCSYSGLLSQSERGLLFESVEVNVSALHLRLKNIALVEADVALLIVNQQSEVLQKVSGKHSAYASVRQLDLSQVLNHGHDLFHHAGARLHRIK